MQKSQILGKKLTEYELHLYEYSAFSLSEEVDMFYCKNLEHVIAMGKINEMKIKSKIQYILEILEQEPVPLRTEDSEPQPLTEI